MIQTKLIFFDGISGTGKTTQAQWLEVQLKRGGTPARWIWEGEPAHPLNWFDEWWKPDFDMAPYFEDIPGIMQRSLDRWQAFIQQALASDTITILEGWPLLNSVGMFVEGDAPHDVLLSYAAQVRTLIAPLSPTLIYYDRPNVRGGLRRIIEIRGQGLERELFHNMGRFPFCKQRGLSGFECVATLWEAKYAIMQELVAGYCEHQMTVKPDEQTWGEWRSRILELLHVESRVDMPEPWQKFVGVYYGEQRIEIELEGDTLVACHENQRTPLLWIIGQTFYLQGWPTIFQFHSTESGVPALTIDNHRIAGDVQTLLRA